MAGAPETNVPALSGKIMTDAQMILAITRLLDHAGAPRGMPLLLRLEWLVNQLRAVWG